MSIDQLGFQGVVGQVAVRRQIHLFHQTGSIGAHRFHRKRERFSNVAGCLAFRKLQEHLKLSLGELFMRRSIVFAVQLARQEFGNGGGDVPTTECDRANRIDDVDRFAFLVEIPARALANQIHRIVLFGVSAQNQDPDIGRFGADHGQRIDATLAGHGQIHHQDIQFSRPNELDGLSPAGSFSCNPQVDMLRKKLPQAGTHDSVVVHNADLYHWFLSFVGLWHSARHWLTIIHEIDAEETHGAPMSRFVIPRRAISLLLAALAAVALMVINEAGYRQSSNALNQIREAEQTRWALNTLWQNLLDAETNQRGYLLTGEVSYRDPYELAIGKVGGHFATLHQLFSKKPTEILLTDVLAGHVARKLAELDIAVRMRKAGNIDAWKFVIDTDVGRQEMESIRVGTNQLIAASNRSIDTGQAQVRKSLQLSRVGIALVGLAGLVAFYLYLRQTQALQLSGERQQEILQRERNALESVVHERTATLAELATHLQNVRETERGYLARELHDELGSLLTAAKLDVARLKSRLADMPEAVQRLQHLTELLNSGIALKRRIIEDLRPSSLSNLGLVASLEILGREFGERAALEVELVLEPVTLDETQQLTVYRMVQESLTNIGKYANAREATIVLKNYASHVIVEVSDNGKGFDVAKDRSSTHGHGLAGMKHRVEAAGGKLTVMSVVGEGTRLTAILPQVAQTAQRGQKIAEVARTG